MLVDRLEEYLSISPPMVQSKNVIDFREIGAGLPSLLTGGRLPRLDGHFSYPLVNKVTVDEFKALIEKFNFSPEDNELIAAALRLAIESHGAEIRKSGMSTLESHTLPVALTVIKHEIDNDFAVTPEIIAAALTHDVLEDNPNVSDEEFIAKLGWKVYSIVKPVSKEPSPKIEGESPEEKTERKIIQALDHLRQLNVAPRESWVIKLSDRLLNLSLVPVPPHYVRESAMYKEFARDKSPAYFYPQLAFRLHQWQELVDPKMELLRRGRDQFGPIFDDFVEELLTRPFISD